MVPACYVHWRGQHSHSEFHRLTDRRAINHFSQDGAGATIAQDKFPAHAAHFFYEQVTNSYLGKLLGGFLVAQKHNHILLRSLMSLFASIRTTGIATDTCDDVSHTVPITVVSHCPMPSFVSPSAGIGSPRPTRSRHSAWPGTCWFRWASAPGLAGVDVKYDGIRHDPTHSASMGIFSGVHRCRRQE